MPRPSELTNLLLMHMLCTSCAQFYIFVLHGGGEDGFELTVLQSTQGVLDAHGPVSCYLDWLHACIKGCKSCV